MLLMSDIFSALLGIFSISFFNRKADVEDTELDSIT